MKKRLWAILATVLLVATMLPVAASANPATVYVYTSNGKTLNMRAYPSMDGEIIANIPYGATVDILSYVNNTWAHCDYNGETGYCKTRYFSTSQPGPKPTNNGGNGGNTGAATNLYSSFYAVNYTAEVRPATPSGFVHMRWAPSKKQPIHRDYYAGAQLVVLAESADWCQVYDVENQCTGYMMRAFLTPIN